MTQEATEGVIETSTATTPATIVKKKLSMKDGPAIASAYFDHVEDIKSDFGHGWRLIKERLNRECEVDYTEAQWRRAKENLVAGLQKALDKHENDR